MKGLSSPCDCGLAVNPWVVDSVLQVFTYTVCCLSNVIITVHLWNVCRKVMLFVSPFIVDVASILRESGQALVFVVGATSSIRSK